MEVKIPLARMSEQTATAAIKQQQNITKLPHIKLKLSAMNYSGFRSHVACIFFHAPSTKHTYTYTYTRFTRNCFRWLFSFLRSRSIVIYLLYLLCLCSSVQSTDYTANAVENQTQVFDEYSKHNVLFKSVEKNTVIQILFR